MRDWPSFERAREKASQTEGTPTEKSRTWWETLPMTYVDWDDEERLPETHDDFRQLYERYMTDNPWLPRFFNRMDFLGKKTLLIGCGGGAGACALARAGADVTAIDLTEKAVGMTRQHAKFESLPIEVVQADAQALPFEDNSFDYVYSWGVIHACPEPELALKEVARVLRPGGQGMLMVYHRSLRYYVRGLYWLFVKGKIFQGETLESVQKYFTDGYFFFHYTRSEFKALLASVGLDAKMSVSQMARPLLSILPRTLDEAIKRNFGWLLIAEMKSQKPE